MTVPLRAALYLRVSTARQAEHDVSIPDQKRQGEAYCAVARLPARRDLCRAGRVSHQRPTARIPADDRSGHEQARAVRYRARPFVQPLLPRPFRTRVLCPQARQERHQAGLDHPGNRRRPDARHDAPDDGAVRRVPVQGERQAHAERHEGKRPPRLLEWLPSADRLSCRRGRAARREGQEEAGNRPAAR